MRKIYLLVMAVIFCIGIAAQDNLVLVVHEEGTSTDQHVATIVEAINAIDGLEADTCTWDDADLATRVDDADAVVITETPNSDDVSGVYTGYRTKPTICLKTYAILARKVGWNWIDDEVPDVPQFNATKEDMQKNADVAGVTEIEILEDHSIFTDIGEQGDMFSFGSQYFQCYNS